MKNKEMVKILDYDIARGFTRHGQHLNLTGKSKVAQIIAQYLTSSTRNKNTDSIPMKWKITNSDFMPTGSEVKDFNKFLFKNVKLSQH